MANNAIMTITLFLAGVVPFALAGGLRRHHDPAVVAGFVLGMIGCRRR